MNTRNIVAASLLVGSAFFARQSFGQFTLVDDLTTGHAPGALDTQAANGPGGGTWGNVGAGTAGTITIGTSSATAGQAAIAGTTDGAAAIALPTAISAASTTATIFFQFDMGSTLTGNNINWSLENPGTAADGGGASANNVIELNANQANRAGLTIRNGGAFNEMSPDGVTVFTPSVATLYSVWFVVNNNAKTYQIYMAGGALGSGPVLMQIGTGAYSATPASYTTTGAFRNPTAATAVGSFVFGPGGAGNLGGQSLLNLWEDSGAVNLSDPTAVPEPSTFGLIGVAGALLTYRLRRRAS